VLFSENLPNHRKNVTAKTSSLDEPEPKGRVAALCGTVGSRRLDEPLSWEGYSFFGAQPLCEIFTT
jgi:hypothetical protein